jgi:hypothetical protein
MSDEHRSPIEALTEQIWQVLPEEVQEDEELATLLGGLCGFVTGCLIGRALVRLLFSPDEKDK